MTEVFTNKVKSMNLEDCRALSKLCPQLTVCEFIETFGSPFVVFFFFFFFKVESEISDFQTLEFCGSAKKTAGLPYAVSDCSFCQVKIHVKKKMKSPIIYCLLFI